MKIPSLNLCKQLNRSLDIILLRIIGVHNLETSHALKDNLDHEKLKNPIIPKWGYMYRSFMLYITCCKP